jgi:hypothetical protein
MKRGRRSTADVIALHGNYTRTPLAPLGTLTRIERRVFDHMVVENPHLKRADIPLLEAFAVAYARVAAAKRAKPEVWEREARVLMALGTKLRVTVQATTEPRTAARRRLEEAAAKPWDRKPWEDDDAQ